MTGQRWEPATQRRHDRERVFHGQGRVDHECDPVARTIGRKDQVFGFLRRFHDYRGLACLCCQHRGDRVSARADHYDQIPTSGIGGGVGLSRGHERTGRIQRRQTVRCRLGTACRVGPVRGKRQHAPGIDLLNPRGPGQLPLNFRAGVATTQYRERLRRVLDHPRGTTAARTHRGVRDQHTPAAKH